ncbi:hypothetical protein HPB47_019707 [Ixodes persulcatus]|uniref:Uncharacterized protein n=1 Tax=Ixodes persulcatus TaxID=34615 RepID=A0AC60QHG5_IXOPE|nr:hypothetical protein HPB47_019707 [Ixodes persulcatus]
MSAARTVVLRVESIHHSGRKQTRERSARTAQVSGVYFCPFRQSSKLTANLQLPQKDLGLPDRPVRAQRAWRSRLSPRNDPAPVRVPRSKNRGGPTVRACDTRS